MSTSLIIFAKYPDPGRVKTRLGREIGFAAAARVYAQFVRTLIQRVAASPVSEDLELAVAPPERLEEFAAEFAGADNYSAQLDTGVLGEKMRHAIQAKLQRGYRKVSVIGTDSPHLPLDEVRQAYALLEASDVVLGPAEDGGYYLIAVKADHPDLFAGVRWSGETVLAQTIRSAERANLSHVLLPVNYDVDTLADLRRLHAEAPDILAQGNLLHCLPMLADLLAGPALPPLQGKDHVRR